ncbi:hypothetical protein quinque_005144 [Culex quinquefasciatus]
MALNSTSIPHSSGPGSPGGSAGTGGGGPGGPGAFKEELDDFERFALENLVRNEWGLKVATLNRLMYCGVSVECLEVIEERDLNDIFKDERAIGQRILLRHRLREWRKGLHWNSPEPPMAKRRYQRRSIEPSSFEPEKKPRITTSSIAREMPMTPPPIMLPDTRNPTVIASSSTSSSSTLTAASLAANSASQQNGAIADAANLPIRVTPESLTGFLQGSRSGRWVLNYFADHHHLDKKALTELTHVIVEPFLIYNITFTHSLMRHYAEIICQLFPSEQMETFYCPRNTVRKNPTGKLYDRYVNQRLRYKTKFNAQRPTLVDESQLHRTFAEMSPLGESVMQQQYLDYTGDHQQLVSGGMSRDQFIGTPPQMDGFSEDSMNVYGVDDGSLM